VTISGITHTVGTREGSVDGGGNGLGEKAKSVALSYWYII